MSPNALWLALKKGLPGIVQVLLEYGGDVNSSHKGEYALTWAARSCYSEAVKFLLSYKPHRESLIQGNIVLSYKIINDWLLEDKN